MESNIRKCKVCLEDKNRILAGKFPNGRDKKWAGDSNLLWNGNICPECNVKESFKKMRKSREKNPPSDT